MNLANSAVCSTAVALSIVAGCLVVPSVALSDLRVDERLNKRF